ncbi:MAG: Crp/Fnr family transcriptional regulator [Crocinitomicaceae bacterium]
MLDRLNPLLRAEIEKTCDVKLVPKDTEIMRMGQYVSVVPIVMEGLVKVFAPHEDKELLLYYIRPSETCIMSFSSAIKKEPSRVVAITEKDSELLLLPTQKMLGWMRDYPDFNMLFFDQYNMRYAEFIDTLNHVVFDKLDKRLLDYLQERVRVTSQNPLLISHREIANELGTAREVVSRVMKKLEIEGKIEQLMKSVRVLDL